jgi:putative addiction module killer protein
MRNTIIRTDVFDAWLRKLKDARGKGRILEQICSMELGHFGESAPIGSGVYELRIHVGSGYRVYYMRHGKAACVLLCGGAKHAQRRDIDKAKALARFLREE